MIWHYIIGDIHGCLVELLDLETKIEQHATRQGVDHLIVSVGDLIDRGPDSAGVIQRFMEGEKRGTHRAIMGNHEMLFLETLQHFRSHYFENISYPKHFSTYRQAHESGQGMAPYLTWEDYQIFRRCFWIGQGGYQTLQSFGCHPNEPLSWQLPVSMIAYLLQLPFVFQTGLVAVTHALVTPEDWLVFCRQFTGTQKINAARFQQVTHSMIWNRQPPVRPPVPDRLHVSGHTPLPRVKRFPQKRCLQIDTSCVFGGRLTAYCVQSDSFLSVPARQNYLTHDSK